MIQNSAAQMILDLQNVFVHALYIICFVYIYYLDSKLWCRCFILVGSQV